VNNIILKIAIQEGLVEVWELKPRDIYSLEIIAGDLLPKDKVQELEQIQQELKMGLDSRKNVMKRLKRNDIESLIKEIDKDRDEKPLVYGVAPVLVAAGQQLVNPETGETIVTNDSNIKLAQMNIDSQQKISKMNAQNTIQATGGKTSQPPQKPVGTNKEGGDLKVNSGVTNTNPGKNS
jgi:hypothetical protein